MKKREFFATDRFDWVTVAIFGAMTIVILSAGILGMIVIRLAWVKVGL